MGAPIKPPQLVKVPIGLKLPRWLIAWFKTQDRSAAKLIEEALREMHGIAPPDKPIKKRG
jgi:hypothetical protein